MMMGIHPGSLLGASRQMSCVASGGKEGAASLDHRAAVDSVPVNGPSPLQCSPAQVEEAVVDD